MFDRVFRGVTLTPEATTLERDPPRTLRASTPKHVSSSSPRMMKYGVFESIGQPA